MMHKLSVLDQWGTDDTMTRSDRGDFKECTESAGMTKIRYWNVDYILNDEPFLEYGLIKGVSLVNRCHQPSRRIFFPDNFRFEIGIKRVIYNFAHSYTGNYITLRKFKIAISYHKLLIS